MTISPESGEWKAQPWCAPNRVPRIRGVNGRCQEDTGEEPSRQDLGYGIVKHFRFRRAWVDGVPPRRMYTP
jgi:hypothetical protein